MEESTGRRVKRTLDEGSLHQFLRYLDADELRAAEEYERIRKKLISFFHGRGFGCAEDLTDVTIDRVALKIGEQVEIQNLMGYILKFARFVASEHHKKTKDVPLADVAEPAHTDVVDNEEETAADFRLRCLEQSMRRLEPGQRALIAEWYLYDRAEKIENKKQMATQLGVPIGTLRVKAFRARQRLYVLIQECVGASMGGR